MLQVVFATAVTKPGHGNIAPLAIGFTLFASAFVGEGDPSQRSQLHSTPFSLSLTVSCTAQCEGHMSCSGLMQADPPQEPP